MDEAVPMGATVRATGRWLEGVPLRSVRGRAGIFILAILVVAFLALVVPPLLDAVQGQGGPEATSLTPDLMWLNIAFQVLLFVVLPVLYLRTVWPGRRLGEVLQARLGPHAVVETVIGIGLGIAILVVLGIVLFALQHAGLIQEEESVLVGEIGRLVREHPEFIIVAPLAAGICEETCFRGFLQPRIGIIASNVLFGLMHLGYGTTLQLVLPAIVGVLFGLVYLRTKSLWTCVAAHATFDLVQLVVLYIAGDAVPSIVGFF